MIHTSPRDRGGKRARLFGRDPVPGFVFSLDTCSTNISISATSYVSPTPNTLPDACVTRRAQSGAKSQTQCSIHRDRSQLKSASNNDESDDFTSSGTTASTAAAACSAGSDPMGCSTAAPSSDSAADRGTIPAGGIELPAAAGSQHAPVVVNPLIAAPSPPTPYTSSNCCTTSVEGDRRSEGLRETSGDVAKNSTDVEVTAKTTSYAQGAPGNRGADGSTGAAAASLVASFLKRGSTSPKTEPAAAVAGSQSSSLDRPRVPSASIPDIARASPPKTPTPLASLVTGVPLGSGGRVAPESAGVGSAGSNSRGLRRADCQSSSGGTTSSVGAQNFTQSSPGGANRLFHNVHNEWAPILKKRRRVLRYPKRSDPAGTRILYWVRGNYRVKDNLGLSVALWLSTRLWLPLQAVTFVDPAIHRSTPSRPAASSFVGGTKHLRSGSNEQHDAQLQGLPFRVAVEVSALCEMEEALRALNVPLVAIACAESEIPSTLACWCRPSTGRSRGSSGTEAAAPSPRADSAASTTIGLPTEGCVHITIMDECYHPKQLSLSEKVTSALAGTGALYSMDSSCVYPVNTSVGGGGGSRRAGESAAAGVTNSILSPEEFRQAQDENLPGVLSDLAPKPRLPLDARLQSQMFINDEKRAILPREFERASSSTGSTFSVLSWRKLRELSAWRFPGFGKPISPAVYAKDLISHLGGGERVGEAALTQTLELDAGLSPDAQSPASSTPEVRGQGSGGIGRAPTEGNSASLETEVAGLGFGGCLLHLLRLGSISSLFVVQTLLRSLKTTTSVSCGEESSFEVCQSRRHLLNEVLKREYALYRSRVHHRELSNLVGIPSSLVAASGGSSSPAAAKGRDWRGKDHWKGIVPAWVWEELRKGQRDARQHQHSPGEIRSAGSTVPSSVQDEIFSAIQVRLTIGGRLEPSLAPYWARAVIMMMLIPSQAVTLLIDLAEELSLGAAAGDLVPDLLDRALGVLGEPPPPSDEVAGSLVHSPRLAEISSEVPIFRRLPTPTLATEQGLESAFGGRDALRRFLSTSFVCRPSAS